MKEVCDKQISCKKLFWQSLTIFDPITRYAGMRASIIIFLALLSLCLKNSGEGCPFRIIVSTSNGIYVNTEFWTPNYCDSVQLKNEDSVTVTVVGGSGCSLSIDNLTLNGASIPYVIIGNYSPKIFSIKAKPGHYILKASYNAVPYTVPFDMYLDATVGIKESSMLNEQILIYPNPAKNFISVNSLKSALKSIELLDADLKIISVTEPGLRSSIEVPLNNLPSGIYFVKVIAQNGNTLLRKVMVF